MNLRKIMIATVVAAMLGTTAAYAADVSHKLRVWINNKKEADDAAVLVDGKPYLSMKAISDKLDGIFLYDESTNKATIFKPNVNILTFKGNDSFSNVRKGAKFSLNVFTQVDSLKVDISGWKVTIEDPYGDVTLIDERSSKDFPELKEDFIYRTKDVMYTFDSVGRYTVRFLLKPAGETHYQVVAESTISSK